MLERLEANRIRQMTERYRITKLLDDLEARSRAPATSSCATMLGSRALGARRARLGCRPSRPPAFSREQIRAALGDARSRAERALELRRRAREAERDDLVELRARSPAHARARRSRTGSIAGSVSAPHANAASIRPRRSSAGPARRGRRRGRSRRSRAGASSAACSPPAPGSGRAAPAATSSTSSRYSAALRSASPQSISPLGAELRASPPRAAAGAGRRRRSARRARCRRCRRRRRRRSRRCGAPRRARPTPSGPMPVEARAELHHPQVLARVLGRGLQRRRAWMAAPGRQRLGDADHAARAARRPST